MLEGATGWSSLDLLTHADQAVGEKSAARLQKFLERRLQDEPVSRILGRSGFYGLDLVVTPDVLDPRADTEGLVDAALAFLRDTQVSSSTNSRPRNGLRRDSLRHSAIRPRRPWFWRRSVARRLRRRPEKPRTVRPRRSRIDRLRRLGGCDWRALRPHRRQPPLYRSGGRRGARARSRPISILPSRFSAARAASIVTGDWRRTSPACSSREAAPFLKSAGGRRKPSARFFHKQVFAMSPSSRTIAGAIASRRSEGFEMVAAQFRCRPKSLA